MSCVGPLNKIRNYYYYAVFWSFDRRTAGSRSINQISNKNRSAFKHYPCFIFSLHIFFFIITVIPPRDQTTIYWIVASDTPASTFQRQNEGTDRNGSTRPECLRRAVKTTQGLRRTPTQVTYLRSCSPPADISYTPCVRSVPVWLSALRLVSSGGVICINVFRIMRVNALLHFNSLNLTVLCTTSHTALITAAITAGSRRVYGVLGDGDRDAVACIGG